MAKKTETTTQDRRNPHARRGHAQEHPDRRIPVGHGEGRAESPIRVAYERRNRDLDPQLVWRGKDEQDWSDLVVQAPPLYIQEKVHPKVLIDDLLRADRERRARSRPSASSTCSPTSTASRRAPTRPSSTSTTRTGRTA